MTYKKSTSRGKKSGKREQERRRFQKVKRQQAVDNNKKKNLTRMHFIWVKTKAHMATTKRTNHNKTNKKNEEKNVYIFIKCCTEFIVFGYFKY